MGGFHLFEHNGRPCHPLSRSEVRELVENGDLFPPSKGEIMTWSKGDALSKGIVLLQTLWFMMQCIARRMEHLSITELEVVTLAYTIINVAMYGFWWNKPLSVGQPIRVFNTRLELTRKSGDGGEGMLGRRGWSQRLLTVIFGEGDEYTALANQQKVPTYWAGGPNKKQLGLAGVIALALAVIFGVVHFISWSSQFPSHLEQILWRASSIAIVCSPIIVCLLVLLDTLPLGINTSLAIVLPSILSILVYIIARVVLLALAFTTLRSLPPTAYQTVHWTTFIPHI